MTVPLRHAMLCSSERKEPTVFMHSDHYWSHASMGCEDQHAWCFGNRGVLSEWASLGLILSEAANAG